MEGQQGGNSSIYICRKNVPQESSSLCQSSEWQGEIDQPQSIFVYNKGIIVFTLVWYTHITYIRTTYNLRRKKNNKNSKF